MEDVPVPQPRPNEVLVAVRANGLCGSDIHFYEDGKLGPFRVDRPYIPGHEACGVVTRAAADGSGPREGGRVSIEPGVPCRRCPLCKSGRYNLCRDVVFMSAPPVNGTFAEYAAVASDFAHPLPDTMDDETGAFVEPLAVAVQACSRSGLSAGATAVVIGAGPIGLVTMLAAAAFGAARLIAVDVMDHRLALASRLCGAATVNPRTSEAERAVSDLTGGLGAPWVFDASGSAAGASLAPRLASRGGVVTLIGWPEKESFPFPVEQVIDKELDVRGVNRYANAYPRSIALLAAGRIDLKPLISHRFPFRETREAFAFASAHRGETVKVMILG